MSNITNANKRKGVTIALYAGLSLFVVWFAVLLAPAFADGASLFVVIRDLPEYINNPFALRWMPNTGKVILIFLMIYGVSIALYISSRRNTKQGAEHGSAKWGNVYELEKKYRAKEYEANKIFTQNYLMGMDDRIHRRNLNSFVVGGSGAGKTRFYAKPNVMQCNCSYIITDPAGEILRSCGWLLQRKGYEIRVFDLIHPGTSMQYNPFYYIKDDKDVLTLITNLIRNTTPKGSMSNDPFWEKAETALLQALMLYLLYEALPYEQTFENVLELMRHITVDEEDGSAESAVDALFDELEREKPNSLAVRQYAIFKQSAGKTAKSILVSAGVRLAAFNIPEIARLTAKDEMDFESIGQRKVALFCVTPVNDKSLNFLISMMYTQLFKVLMDFADAHCKHNRLPMPIHCVMDEFANIALPDGFDNIVATIRKYQISVSIIVQNIAQLKALFDKQWESIVGNCDELLYLGGNEQSTHKYVSELLGKETIDTNTYGHTRGRSGSYSTNYQTSGLELMSPDQVRTLDNSKALLFISRENAIVDDKYDLMKHPNIKYTEDGGAEPYVYTKDLERTAYVPTQMGRYALLSCEEAAYLLARNSL